MRLRIPSIFIALVIAVLAAGCTFSVDGGGGGNGDQVDYVVPAEAGGTSDSPERTLSIGANDSVLVEVTLSQAARGEDAIYFELGTENSVEMVLADANFNPLASSTSAEYFLEGLAAVASSAVSPSAIVVTDLCAGVCIIRNANRSSFILEVANTASTQRSIQLYVYTAPFSDEYEFANDTVGGGFALTSGDVDTGAIETLGDRDYWQFLDDGQLYFSATTPAEIDLAITFVDADGVVLDGPYAPSNDQPLGVDAGEYAFVHELDGDAAGPSGSTLYTLELATTVN